MADADGLAADIAGVVDLDQPGLSDLREAVANAGRHLPHGGTLRSDVIAGLNGALTSVRDGMASGRRACQWPSAASASAFVWCTVPGGCSGGA